MIWKAIQLLVMIFEWLYFEHIEVVQGFVCWAVGAFNGPKLKMNLGNHLLRGRVVSAFGVRLIMVKSWCEGVWVRFPHGSK